jgi:hypothetical protein
MRESDFEKLVVERVRGSEEHVRERVARPLIEELKAGGMTFDPEEEPLPERIEVRRYPGQGMALWPEGKTSMSVGNRERIYDEAVRRYNEFSSTRAAFESWDKWPRTPKGDAAFFGGLRKSLFG